MELTIVEHLKVARFKPCLQISELPGNIADNKGRYYFVSDEFEKKKFYNFICRSHHHEQTSLKKIHINSCSSIFYQNESEPDSGSPDTGLPLQGPEPGDVS
jgi:hypothetical protein